MRLTTRVLATALAAGVAGAGALALMTPAVAAVATHPMSWTAGTGDGGGSGYGRGMGSGMGRRDGSGQGPGMGSRGNADPGDCLVTAGQGVMTDRQRTTLAALAQEEKLAHDLYTAFGSGYQVAVFSRIAAAEERHLATLRTLMTRYQVSDPTAGQPAGKFTQGTVQATYDRLLADGSRDVKAAYGVGRTVEQTDIDDLRQALDGLAAPDARQVYTNLQKASGNHLTAFDNWSKR